MLLALVRHGTVAAASRACKVAQSTIYRHLEDADFKHKLRSLRSEMLEHAFQSIQDSTQDAARTLRELMNNEKCPFVVRASVARTVMELAVKGAEIQEFQQRLEHLEANLNKLEEKPR